MGNSWENTEIRIQPSTGKPPGPNSGMGLSHQEVAVQQRGRRVDFSSQTGERERVGYHTSSLDQPS